MTVPFSPTAAQNGPLLRAIRSGEATSPSDLADRAGVLPNHIHRKLDSLEAEGFIFRATTGPKHVAAVTEAGERVLAALDLYETGAAPAGDVVMIPIDRIDFNPDNPRKTYDMFAIPEMAQSIADKGVLQPLMVRARRDEFGQDRFELIIGERRLRGAQRARDLRWVAEDYAVPCQVREVTDDEAFEIMGVENLQREDLHWMDEAEFYKGLADRGRSAAQIERLIGSGVRKKRSIQERIQFARELSDADKARTRLPDGDPQRLTVDQCRAMVGEKKERPALDINPRLTLALLELLDARPEVGPLKQGDEHQVRLYAAPVGGPLVALADRKLLAWAFAGPDVVAKVRITEDLHRFLEQKAFGEDFSPERQAALLAARRAAMGDLQATTVSRGEYATPELNPPPEPAVPLAAAPDPNAPNPNVAADPAPPDPAADGGEASPQASPAPRQEPEPEPAPDEAHQLVILELAHKIWHAGQARTPGDWGAEVAQGWHLDRRAQPMIFAKLIRVAPMGARTLMSLTDRSLDWLGSQGAHIEDGRAAIGDELLLYRQLEHDAEPVGPGPYSIAWLNPERPAKAEAPEAAAPGAGTPTGTEADASQPSDSNLPPAAAIEVLSPPPSAATFADQVRRVSAEGRVIQGLAAANREAVRLIRSAVSRKLTSTEADKVVALLEAAHDAARPHIDEAAQ
jgi:ParB/RepB/Spo0J family partition protein